MIRSVAVLGAGTMGAQIAAHAANAGLRVLLLDLSADIARQGLERAARLKPDPFFTPDARWQIDAAGFDEGIDELSAVDWVIEAVVERIEVKRELFARVEGPAANAIISSNTSGLPIASLGEGRSESFRHRLLGTHFFNPPRYLPLLEIIPTPDTDPAITEQVAAFADRRLGKGVVLSGDCPGFIANRLGLFGFVRLLRLLQEGRHTVEEIDEMTGRAIGRPKSATFRTVDIAGLDILASVARDLTRRLEDPAEREAFELPPIVDEMLRRGWVGEKAGQGFYKRVKSASGETEILVLDPGTMTYRPQRRPKLGAIEAAKAIENTAERLRSLFLDRHEVGEVLRATLGPTLRYAARFAPTVARSLDDVDRVMKWGFGWELGPFETWDAIGPREILAATSPAEAAAGGARAVDAAPVTTATPPEAGGEIGALIAQVLAGQRPSFRARPAVPPRPGIEILREAKERQRVIRANAGASLVDVGDGVLAVEFHSKMNAIGGDAIEALHAGIAEAEKNFRALLVGNDAPNFSAGANLMLVLLEAQEENWDEIDAMVRAFQSASMALRCAAVPVVVAPAGMALGGGCEIVLHGRRVQAAAETYMGLVEVGVGLIPAGGGTKEMLARAVDGVMLTPQLDLLAPVQRVFETIGFAKVSTSAADAKRIGYLRQGDSISMNRSRVMADAKTVALALAETGNVPEAPRTAIPVGGENVYAALTLGIHLARRAGRITDHDSAIGRRLAWILAGGGLPHATTVGEQHLLDLEREAFLSLCGEPLSQARMQHMLATGKALRN